jgi:hypothetical protein
MQPQQHFGEVVQQRGLVDHRRVVVKAVHGEAERQPGGAVGAPDDFAQALQRLRLPVQVLFDGGLRPEEGFGCNPGGFASRAC